MFKLSFRFTFGTNRDINFRFWTVPSLLRFGFYDDEEPELKPQETDIKISPNLIYDTISPPIHRI
jgi:hypothetical protein